MTAARLGTQKGPNSLWHRDKASKEANLSHSKNLESLPVSYHFPCARPHALLTRPSLLLTQSKLPKCLREMLTQSYATQGFAYAEDLTLGAKGR